MGTVRFTLPNMPNPTTAAHEALASAWACIRAAALSLEIAQRSPQADQDEAYALAHHDLAEALSALDDAGRAVAAADLDELRALIAPVRSELQPAAEVA